MPKRNVDLLTYFPNALQPGVIEPFIHKGDWAIHQTVSSLVDAVGPADFRIMSYNISEDSLRSLFLEPRIRSMKVVLDMTIRRHKLDLLYFMGEITRYIRLDSCHAKVFLAENDDFSFGIVGSQNLNLVHRYESGFYFTRGPHFDYFKTHFDLIYDQAIPYDTTKSS